jgi:hypothetical protein
MRQGERELRSSDLEEVSRWSGASAYLRSRRQDSLPALIVSLSMS